MSKGGALHTYLPSWNHLLRHSRSFSLFEVHVVKRPRDSSSRYPGRSDIGERGFEDNSKEVEEEKQQSREEK